MSDGPLGNIEMTREGVALNPEEFVDTVHDPETLYYYIQDAANKANQDLTIDAGDSALSVKIHAKVEVFQSAIQFVEAFGIYLTSYLQGNENLIEHLVQTRPSDVTTLFEHIQEDTIDEWLVSNDIDESYQSVLKTIFGYIHLTVDNIDRNDGEEVTEEDLEEVISQSTTTIQSELRAIGEYYTTFHDIYNAVKHGNRALPQTTSGVQMTPSDDDTATGQEIVEGDFDFVLFVCKNQNGNPYLAGLPINYLINHTLTVVERTYRLFTHLKTVSNAAITDDTFDVPFYSTTTVDTDESEDDADARNAEPDWITASHSSGIMILPYTEELAEYHSEPRKNTFAARFEVDSDTLLIRTQMHDGTSEEYPITVSLRQRGTVGLTPQPIITLNVNIGVMDIDAIQYYELLKLQDLIDDEELGSILVIDEQSDTETPVGRLEDFPQLDLEELMTREQIEQVALLQQITQRRIPAPTRVSEEQVEVIDECLTAADLTRDDAIAAVEAIEELGQELEFTEIFVDKLAPDGTRIASEYIGEIASNIRISRGTTTGEELPNSGNELRIPTTITDIEYEGLVEALQEDLTVLDGILDQTPMEMGEGTPTPPRIFILLNNETGRFWAQTYVLRIQVIERLDDAVSMVRCKLCGESTMDMNEHLLEDCGALE